MLEYGKIKRCTISHTDAPIILPYIDSVDNINYIRNKRQLHSGIDISCNVIYAPCNCVILSTNKVDTFDAIILQYSASICLRFTHLKSVVVQPGNLILADTKLGVADSYVHVEYLDTSVGTIPDWVVRIGPLQLYKHNPISMLDGTFVYDNEVQLQNDYDYNKYFTQTYPPGYYEGPRF